MAGGLQPARDYNLPTHNPEEDTVDRRGILKTMVASVAAAAGFSRWATPAQAQTKHIRLYVEMDVPAARERQMLDIFHNTFQPEAAKHDGYIRVKMLKRRSIIQGTVPANQNYRFELEFENEELRQKWIASDAHQRVWPPLEKTMTTTTGYPVVLYDEV